MLTRSLLPAAAAILALAGCYRPEGALMGYTGMPATYWSTESRPATITVVDTRTGEPFFTMEIPVGRELVLDFKEGEGDDPALLPDLMRWEVFPRGTQTGTLKNAISVPNRFSRRIDVDYRPAPEYAPKAADRPARSS